MLYYCMKSPFHEHFELTLGVKAREVLYAKN
jgi:hypothetical protein